MTTSSYKVSLAHWQDDFAVLSQIRFTVFVREQGIPPEFELDAMDADEKKVVHVIARDETGQAIGTARMLLDQSIPRIGRMAVLKSCRGKGVGKDMLEFLCNLARKKNYRVVRLNSQTHATAFYYKQGFLSHGEEFTEAGIPHLEMRRSI